MFDCVLQYILTWQRSDEYKCHQADILKLAKLRLTASTKNIERKKTKRTAKVAGLDELEALNTSNNHITKLPSCSSDTLPSVMRALPPTHLRPEHLDLRQKLYSPNENTTSFAGLTACDDHRSRSPLVRLATRSLNHYQQAVGNSNDDNPRLHVGTRAHCFKPSASVNHLNQPRVHLPVPSIDNWPNIGLNGFQNNHQLPDPLSNTIQYSPTLHSSSRPYTTVDWLSHHDISSLAHSPNSHHRSPFQLLTSYATTSLLHAQVNHSSQPYIESLHHSQNISRSSSNLHSSPYPDSSFPHNLLNWSNPEFRKLPLTSHIDYRDANCYVINPKSSNTNVTAKVQLTGTSTVAIERHLESHR